MQRTSRFSTQFIFLACFIIAGPVDMALGENLRIQHIESVEKEIEAFRKHLKSNRTAGRSIDKYVLRGELPDDIEIEFVKVPATTSMEWKEISGGKDYFLMGDNRGDYSPVRFVKLDYDFFIAKTEVSQRQWNSLMGAAADNRGYVPNPEVPVNEVNWPMAMNYINKFSDAYSLGFVGKLRKFFTYRDYVYRLPTEVEWEYASRAGLFEPSQAYLKAVTWSGNQSRSREPVGSKRPNPWGIHDMLGNVFELTADCWPSGRDIRFGKQNLVKVNPVGSGRHVNSRGGAWYSTEHVQSFAWRSSCNTRHYRGDHLGLRLVLAPPLSQLNKAPKQQPKPKPRLVSDKVRPMKLMSRKDCDRSFNIIRSSVLREFNDRITMEICYENKTSQALTLSALTYMERRNTGKWNYQPVSAKPGRGCTRMGVGKSSLFAYSSDAIEIGANGSSCRTMFKFKKRWTDGHDEKKQH